MKNNDRKKEKKKTWKITTTKFSSDWSIF